MNKSQRNREPLCVNCVRYGHVWRNCEKMYQKKATDYYGWPLDIGFLGNHIKEDGDIMEEAKAWMMKVLEKGKENHPKGFKAQWMFYTFIQTIVERDDTFFDEIPITVFRRLPSKDIMFRLVQRTLGARKKREIEKAYLRNTQRQRRSYARNVRGEKYMYSIETFLPIKRQKKPEKGVIQELLDRSSESEIRSEGEREDVHGPFKKDETSNGVNDMTVIDETKVRELPLTGGEMQIEQGKQEVFHTPKKKTCDSFADSFFRFCDLEKHIFCKRTEEIGRLLKMEEAILVRWLKWQESGSCRSTANKTKS